MKNYLFFKKYKFYHFLLLVYPSSSENDLEKFKTKRNLLGKFE